MMFTDDAKAVIAFTTRLGSSRRPSLSPGKWHRLATALGDAGLTPAALFDDDVLDEAPIPAELLEGIRVLRSDAVEAILEADDLGRKGIWVLTVADAAYPAQVRERLGGNAPPVLFGAGNQDLLSGDGIGIVGSRDVDEAGAEVAQAAAREAVKLGRAVVSGGARGVDQLAMNAAYQAGGSVVGVLADSLLGRIRKPDVLAALDAGSTCLISQQSPSAGFTAASAMGRNKVIYALSALTLVVATSEGSGGTWAGATEAMKATNGVVAVWRGPGEGPGNVALQEAGVRPVSDLDQLSGLLSAEPDAATEQLSLY